VAAADPRLTNHEFLILPFRASNRQFRASNRQPFDFEWVSADRVRDAYASILLRLIRAYERR